jgi:hypothetical protein
VIYNGKIIRHGSGETGVGSGSREFTANSIK